MAQVEVLRRRGTDSRLRPIALAESQACFGAALAAAVAAWEAYCEAIVNEFFDVTADPLDIRFSALHDLGSKHGAQASKLFNTPNFEKARVLLLTSTGFDPYQSWSWPARRKPVLFVKQFLDEVVQVRHSFAHGFKVPACSWTQDTRGKVRLTASAIADVQALLANLVKRTDSGLKQYISSLYGLSAPW